MYPSTDDFDTELQGLIESEASQIREEYIARLDHASMHMAEDGHSDVAEELQAFKGNVRLLDPITVADQVLSDEPHILRFLHFLENPRIVEG
jgi:hypothetical protein